MFRFQTVVLLLLVYRPLALSSFMLPVISIHPNRDYYYDEQAFRKGECGLDMCSGATNSSGGYNYYTSSNFPYVPICYWGTQLGQYCGFIPS